MRSEKTETGAKPGERASLRARARRFATWGQPSYQGSSDGLHHRGREETPITSAGGGEGKEPIQEEDGKDSSPSTSSSSPPARILLADDHPIFRDALRQLLEEASDLEVAGEAANGREALELCRSLEPDLVLMDVRMPKMDGLEATRAIKREFPKTLVLILTSFDEPGFLMKALSVGADGYVLKLLTRERLLNAIRRVLRGETPLNQELAAELIVGLDSGAEQGSGPPQPLGKGQEPPPELLTHRELEVLRLLARGKHNPQIAQELGIGEGTVKIHVHHIISKLGVSDRTEAVVRAIDLGLLTPEPE